MTLTGHVKRRVAGAIDRVNIHSMLNERFQDPDVPVRRCTVERGQLVFTVANVGVRVGHEEGIHSAASLVLRSDDKRRLISTLRMVEVRRQEGLFSLALAQPLLEVYPRCCGRGNGCHTLFPEPSAAFVPRNVLFPSPV